MQSNSTRGFLSEISFPVALWGMQLALTLGIVFVFHHVIAPGPHPLAYWVKTLGGWDGGSYMKIAERGYQSIQSTAFFPGFPLLIRFTHVVFRLSYFKSGLVISNVSFLAALILLYRLFQGELKTENAEKALWLLFCFPVGFFFNMVYSESINLLAFVMFFYFIRRQRWFLAMLSGGMAACIHDLGVLLVLPALYYWWTTHDRPLTGKSLRSLVAVGVIPLGLLCYMGFLFFKFNSPLAFLQAESDWGRHAAIPIVNVIEQFAHLHIHATSLAVWNSSFVTLVNGSITLLFYFLVVVSLFQSSVDTGMKIFLISMLLASTSSITYNGIESYARFMLVLFPCFSILAKICKNHTIFMLLLLLLFCAKVLLTGMFGDGYVIT